ncbi:MAG: CRISPR-associated endonuclease Cas1 [Candidatus Hodarchaeaceae archaeon]|nr:CRISPR-associated endonuclease Cas1 [Candidatus Hodarchaeaceae archaeon]
MHSIQFAKPSLVCDIQEIFRGMIDKFLIGYAQKLNQDSFERKGERMFLKRKESYKLIKAINKLLDRRIEHQRIKKYGEHSKIRTAIGEEPMKLAQYLRDEKENYEPIGAFL